MIYFDSAHSLSWANSTTETEDICTPCKIMLFFMMQLLKLAYRHFPAVHTEILSLKGILTKEMCQYMSGTLLGQPVLPRFQGHSCMYMEHKLQHQRSVEHLGSEEHAKKQMQ